METIKEAENEAIELAGLNKKEIVLMTKFSPVPFAKEILKENKFIYDKYKRFWRYNKEEGLWEIEGEQFIKTELRKNLFGDEQQKKIYADEIVAYIKDLTYNPNFEPNNNPYLIPLKNKIFDLKENTIKDYDPKYFITNKLDIDLDENYKECPLIDSFFKDCVGEEYKDILYDLAAYLLVREVPYQKLFFIFGPAGTGKSVFLSLLEKFIGSKNCCSVEPQKIQRDKHSTAQMWLKLANIVSDINYDSLDNINQVKKLCGGDTITIRQMYKDGFDEKLYAKQIFSTNKLPAVKEKTKAWYRRLYLIEFSNIIKKELRDPFILSTMTSEEELKGFTYKCIEHLKELYKHKFVFTYDIDEEKVAEVYEELSNPILLFINENCTIDTNGWIFKYDFEERLNNWLKTNHFPPHTRTQINQYMKEVYNESNRESFSGGKNYRVWIGLRWKKEQDISLLNQFNQFNGKIKKVYIYKR